MTPRAAFKGGSLWLLDIAFLLLGGLLLILVMRLLRFDAPEPLLNAWTYVLGVPTILITVSMLTHTLSNDLVERSIQVGFLASVILHLTVMFGASQWHLFIGPGDSPFGQGEVLAIDRPVQEIQQVKSDSSPPVYYEPQSYSAVGERPDYMRPIPTETEPVELAIEETKQSVDSAPLNLTPEKPELAPTPPNAPALDQRQPMLDAEPDIAPLQNQPNRPEMIELSTPLAEVIEVPTTNLHSPAPTEGDLAPLAVNNITKSATSSTVGSVEKLSPPDASFNTLANHLATPSPSRLPMGSTDRQGSLPQGSEPTFIDDSRFSEFAPSSTLELRHSQDRGGAAVAGGAVAGEEIPIEPGMGAVAEKGPSTELLSPEALGSEGLREGITKGTNAQGKGGSTLAMVPIESLGLDRLPGRANGLSTRFEPSGSQSSLALNMPLPDIGRFDVSPGALTRPERSGGAGLAAPSVPIPTPAFSQRIQRVQDRERQAASSLGPLGPQTERAIEMGLQFLAKHQRKDGSWQLGDFGEPVRMQSTTAATALALLSFQGAGYTHKQFKYQSVCRGAIDALRKGQRPNGDLYQRGDPVSDANAWLYSHAIAALALSEAYGMTQDDEIRESAQRAIDFLVNSQDPVGGGWRYTPKIGSDTSVTGWVMMALKSAELAGLQVPKNVYGGISKWLENSQAREAPYLYRYNWQANTPSTEHGRIPTPVMTSVGLLMRLYTGWKRGHPQMDQGTTWLLRYPPREGTERAPARDTYYWYYATQVMFHQGGDKWKVWYNALYPLLIQSQIQQGEMVGSWEPLGPVPDAWGEYGGRLYVTTLNLLSLEVYYRHLPLYEATAE